MTTSRRTASAGRTATASTSAGRTATATAAGATTSSGGDDALPSWLCEVEPPEVPLKINSLNSMFSLLFSRPCALTMLVPTFLKVALPGDDTDPLEQEAYVHLALGARRGKFLPAFYGFTRVWCDMPSVMDAVERKERQKEVVVSQPGRFMLPAPKAEDAALPAIMCEALEGATPLGELLDKDNMTWLIPQLRLLFNDMRRLSDVAGFNHGDLHPSNVLWTKTPAPGRLVVIDLGRAYAEMSVRGAQRRSPMFALVEEGLQKKKWSYFTKRTRNAIWADLGGLALCMYCNKHKFREALIRESPPYLPRFLLPPHGKLEVMFNKKRAIDAWNYRDADVLVGALGWAAMYTLTWYSSNTMSIPVTSLLGGKPQSGHGLFYHMGQTDPYVYNDVVSSKGWLDLMTEASNARASMLTEASNARASMLSRGTQRPSTGRASVQPSTGRASVLLPTSGRGELRPYAGNRRAGLPPLYPRGPLGGQLRTGILPRGPPPREAFPGFPPLPQPSPREAFPGFPPPPPRLPRGPPPGFPPLPPGSRGGPDNGQGTAVAGGSGGGLLAPLSRATSTRSHAALALASASRRRAASAVSRQQQQQQRLKELWATWTHVMRRKAECEELLQEDVRRAVEARRAAEAASRRPKTVAGGSR